MANRSRKNCNRSIHVFDPEIIKTRNPKNGHEYHKTKLIVVCTKHEDYLVCHKICKDYVFVTN